MQLHTMAMQIGEKNWSVAAAILGSEITDKPMAESYGSFVVVNTFAANGHIYRSRGVRYGNPRENMILRNIVLSGEDFQGMFDYDKRTKNLENFFEVTQINEYPIKIHPDTRVEEAIRNLNEAWTSED